MVDSAYYSDIIWNGTLFVVISEYSGGVADYSYDGITWFSTSMGSGSYSSIAWNGTYFVAVTNDGTGNYALSTDGISWTINTLPFSDYYSSICWNGSMFVVLGESGQNQYNYSYDGVTWNTNTIPADYYINLIWNGLLFLAVTYSSAYTSSDGLTWSSPYSLPSYNAPFAIAADDINNIFYLTDSNGVVYSTTDGTYYNTLYTSAINYEMGFGSPFESIFTPLGLTTCSYNSSTLGVYGPYTFYSPPTVGNATPTSNDATAASTYWVNRNSPISFYPKPVSQLPLTDGAGDGQLAIGDGAQAITSSGATAIGQGSTASGENSVAIGYSSFASGQNATAFGSQNYCIGDYSISAGWAASAYTGSSYCIAFGAGSYVQQNQSFQTALGAIARTEWGGETFFSSGTNYNSYPYAGAPFGSSSTALIAKTTDATPTEMYTGINNYLALGATEYYYTYLFDCKIVAATAGNPVTDCSSWALTFLVYYSTGNIWTIVGVPTAISLYSTSGAVTWSVSASIDGSGQPGIFVTGATGITINWTATVSTTKVLKSI